MPVPDITILLDCEAHSGSPNLLPLIKQSEDLIGTQDMLIVMASNGAFNFDRLWVLNSTRGYVTFDLNVSAVEGHHSYHLNDIGGIVPDCYRILQELVDRIEDPLTGKLLFHEEDYLSLQQKEDGKFNLKEATEQKKKEGDILIEAVGDQVL